MADLEWSSQSTLQHYLHTLLLTAPFDITQQHQQQEQQQQEQLQQQQQQEVAELQSLLQLLRPLVSSSSKRLGGREVQLLAQVFFNPQLFANRCVGCLCVYQGGGVAFHSLHKFMHGPCSRGSQQVNRPATPLTTDLCALLAGLEAT